MTAPRASVRGGVAALALLLVAAMVPTPRAQTVRYDHRVVVPTTSQDRESDIDGSLERNVNELAARGWELAAFVGGGDPAVLDRLLARRGYSAGFVDHSGLTLVVMTRPAAGVHVARQYRLLHVRDAQKFDHVVRPLGGEGYRLTVSEYDGENVHLAFERIEGLPHVEYRVFQNRGRRSWMDLAMADPDARMRITRVQPAGGYGIVELGATEGTAAEMRWLSKQTHDFETLEDPLRDLAKTGFRVETVRARGNNLDVLTVKPAGAVPTGASYDLDDGPWGGPCSSGNLVGAAVMPDGDAYCVADRAGAATSNRGLDLTISPQRTADGHLLFRGPTCDVKARLSSLRPGGARVAFAVQFEQEIARALEPGYRVTRALTAVDSFGQQRIVVFTTNAALLARRGPAADPSEPPPLAPELDARNDDLARQREVRLNTALAARRLPGSTVWLELGGIGRSARLLGCVPTSAARDTAESAAKGVLINLGLIDYRVENRVIVDR